MKRGKSEKKVGERAGMPAVFAAQDEGYVARGVIAVDGLPLVVYRIALPRFAAEDGAGARAKDPLRKKRRGRASVRMDAFYRRIAEGIWQGCEERLFPFVRRAYEGSDDPLKRFRFSRYTLTADFTVTVQGGVVCVERRAFLSRRGKTLCLREWRECFSEGSERVLMGKLTALSGQVKPKKGLRDTLTGVISRHTGTHFQEKSGFSEEMGTASVTPDSLPPSPRGEGI